MFYWDQPFPLAGLVEFLRVLVGKKTFLVGLVDQVFQAAQNFVESFFLFDLCHTFFCAALSFTSVRCSFNRHRFLVSAVHLA